MQYFTTAFILLFFISFKTSTRSNLECYYNKNTPVLLQVCFIGNTPMQEAVEASGFNFNLDTSRKYHAITYRMQLPPPDSLKACAMFFRDKNSLQTIVHEATHCGSIETEEEARAQLVGKISEELIDLMYITDHKVFTSISTEFGKQPIYIFENE